jgi:hypothetical protein
MKRLQLIDSRHFIILFIFCILFFVNKSNAQILSEQKPFSLVKDISSSDYKPEDTIRLPTGADMQH